MSASTTVVSTKGQVILPKGIRDRLCWNAGTRLTVEETPAGVLLRPASYFETTRLEDVMGCLKSEEQPTRSIEEMDAGVAAEARRQHARD